MDKMDKNPKDFPSKPAPPGYLSGQEGAAPSSSSDGPSGKRGAARAAPRTTVVRLPDDPRLSPANCRGRQLATSRPRPTPPEVSEGFRIASYDAAGFDFETEPCPDCLDRSALNLLGLPHQNARGIWTAAGCAGCKGSGRIERATGLPAKRISDRGQGRPKRGSEQPWKLVARLGLILALDKPGKVLLGEIIDADRSVNIDDLAKHSGEGGFQRRKGLLGEGKPATLPRRSLFRYRSEVAQNPPISEGTKNVEALMDVQRTATRGDLAELHEQLREQMRREHEELVRLLFVFQYGETPIEAWERLLEDAA